MGLDVVELVLEAEDAFRIVLADDETSRVVTAGDLHEAILRQLPEPKRTLCLTAAAFYRIRQTLVDITGRDRSEIRPGTRLAHLLPPETRKSAWRDLSRSLDLRMPSLDIPKWGVPLVFGCGLATGVLLGALLPRALIIVAAIGAMAGILVAARLVHAMFGTSLPDYLPTVGQLAAAVVAKNYARLSGESSAQDPEEVWQSLRLLIAEQLAMDPAKITKQSRLGEDPGM